MLDIAERGGEIVAGYAWRREPAVRAGELRLTTRGDRLASLIVTFG